jgi:UDP-N-acetylglucosamine acyltransferase
MAGSHVGHDCLVGNHAVLANNVMLGGHAVVGDHAFLGGGSGVHQFTRVGESAMVGGLARITQDIAPYLMVVERNVVVGLNRVGLRRRGFSQMARSELSALYHRLFDTPANLRELAAVELAAGQCQSPEAKRFLIFFATGERGFARARHNPTRLGSDGHGHGHEHEEV